MCLCTMRVSTNKSLITCAFIRIHLKTKEPFLPKGPNIHPCVGKLSDIAKFAFSMSFICVVPTQLCRIA